MLGERRSEDIYYPVGLCMYVNSLEHVHEGFIVRPRGYWLLFRVFTINHDVGGHVLGNLYHGNANDVVSNR